MKERCLIIDKYGLTYKTGTYVSLIIKDNIEIKLPENCELRTIDGTEGKYEIVITK